MKIIPVFQPIFNSLNGSYPSAEVLARWVNPVGKLFGPSNFGAVGVDWARVDIEIAQNLIDMRSQINERFNRLFLNVSIETLKCEKSFSIWRRQVSKISNFMDGDLTIEITEGVSPEVLEKRWCQIAECGVTFALDDYGTYHSDLERLKAYPWLFCKIDVDLLLDFNCCTDAQFCAKAGLNLIAEKVETKDQLELANEFSVFLQQGFIHHRPEVIQNIKSMKRIYENV